MLILYIYDTYNINNPKVMYGWEGSSLDQPGIELRTIQEKGYEGSRYWVEKDPGEGLRRIQGLGWERSRRRVGKDPGIGLSRIKE